MAQEAVVVWGYLELQTLVVAAVGGLVPLALLAQAAPVS